MSVVVVIPARYASTRYPGKPLVKLRGATGQLVSLLERSWRAALSVKGVDRVLVATDDARVSEEAVAFGAEVVMTSETCRNGSERCADAINVLKEDFDIVVNFQGDAPLTPPWFVEDLIAGLKANPSFDVATPVLRADGATLASLREDRRHGRVGATTAIFDKTNRALYFSKEIVPYVDGTYADDEETPVFHHVGVYAFRKEAMSRYLLQDVGTYEQLEGLEQLRFIENGDSVLCVEVKSRGRSFWELNNPEDVPRIEEMLLDMNQP